ncbi:hypothetical protein LCGC14_1309900 [marine sediment metagenome]|uniref:Uncharacterized protein n=1 Tax=marine sediment metagenome TaxID=412755 RepID=A0A0F9KMS6_9ZZZZ
MFSTKGVIILVVALVIAGLQGPIWVLLLPSSLEMIAAFGVGTIIGGSGMVLALEAD